MPIITDAPGSGSPLDVVPRGADGGEWRGWWAARLAKRVTDAERLKRLKLLDDWYRGEAPIPGVTQQVQQAFAALMRNSRTNFAELIVSAVQDRLQPRGIRTSTDGDETGDKEAWRIWRRAGLPLLSADVHGSMLRFGEVPIIVGAPDPVTRVPVFTLEDPRHLVAEAHPEVPSRTVAALKLVRDELAGRDVAYLYRPGRVDVAYRAWDRRVGASRTSTARFDAKSWDWDDDPETGSRDLPDGLMPVVMFRNRDGLAEFESHLDLLQRINTMILQRVVIAVLQAFRQRYAEGLPATDKAGQRIDWNELFAPGPDAFWALPTGAVLKELGQVDLTPILSATREDVKQLAAVTRTPMHMLDPSGENQSAEGAALSREGLVFKTEDRQRRADAPWESAVATSFMWLASAARSTGDEQTAGEQESRADLDGLSIIWAPADRASLSERANALAQSNTGGVPWRSRMIEFGGFAPEQVDRMEPERVDDLLLAQRYAASQSSLSSGRSLAPAFVEPAPAAGVGGAP